jgi:hypothetical protein
MPANDFSISLRPFGPSPANLDAIGARVLTNPAVRKSLGRAKHRLLSVEAVDAPEGDKTAKAPTAPKSFRATLYDYTNDRTLHVDGSLAKPNRVTITESALQPPLANEEWQEATETVRRHTDFAEHLKAGQRRIYRPMPHLVATEAPDGRSRRAIAVGLFDDRGSQDHEIVGVDLRDRALLRFDERAPSGSRPTNLSTCGAPPDANQATAARGTAGQAWVTVSQAGKVLWKFLAVRPAASSGTNGSGIELRYVDYKGKRVLYRAHVPILNVKYDNNACGPYRDWQWQEGEIQAHGSDPLPGFRLCTSPAKTILDTASDTGNFLGVGVYVRGQEVVLVSEMEAGWYRYVSEWRFHTNGTLRPRFGFAAVESQCVCNRHHHHCYWRFDFDIRTAANNRVREFNNPPIIGGGRWHTKRFEIRRPRDPAHKRKWRVENTATGEAYEIIPGAEDGVAALMPDWPYGRGDVWILRYRGSEIDDGSVAVGPPYEADINRWVNGESVSNADVVVWYGAHFTHDLSHEDAATHGHIVGPDLRPVGWGGASAKSKSRRQ